MGPVGRFQRLTRRLDLGRAPAEVQQQVVEAERWRNPGIFGAKVATALNRHAVADAAARRILATGNGQREIHGG